jgi:hypothetical protein
MKPSDVKFIVLTAEYIDHKFRSRYSAQLSLIMGVYERATIPAEKSGLSCLKTHFRSNVTPEREIHNQTTRGVLVATKTISDNRNVESILDELIEKYDGEKWIVNDHRITFPNDLNQPYSKARFAYIRKDNILDEYFGLK